VIGRLAWATARAARGTDDDEPLALAALAAAGVRVDVVDWDDPAARWDSYDRVALRSTWDYPHRLGEFLGWLEAVERVTDVRNPPALVRWNLDKRYLGELADAGVPTIPTTFVEPGGAAEFPAGEFVIKPAVGAGSRDVAAYAPGERAAAAAHVARLHERGGTVLVQPRIASVAEHGEWALLFFAGRFSHAANKRVELAPAGSVAALHVAEDLAAHDADAAQVEVARAAVDAVAARFGVPAYARVDLVRDGADGADGGHLVLEVELVEPSLFLPHGGPAAAGALAAALTG
jgi:glutathione synthase/RimK-type ligase-like ATP-grasp enzyme